MRTRIIPRSHQLCIALIVVLLASACAEEADDATPTTTAATADGVTTTTAASSTPSEPQEAETASDGPPARSEVTFVYANPYVFPDLDPSAAFSNENVLFQNVYETLTRVTDPDSSDKVSGVLAESWESNQDSTRWTFKLREGVTFHDGATLTAGSVRDSIQRSIDLGLGASFILLPIESMEVVDDLTITFNLSYPAPLDLVMSAQFAVYVMCPSVIDQEGAWFNQGNACGTGPWVIESHDPVGSTFLTRFEDYWGGWSDNQIDSVDIRVTEDPVLAEQLIRNGSAHYTFNLPFDVYKSLDQVNGISVVRSLSMTNLFGLLNAKRLSPQVREALVLSFPYDDIVGSLYGGEAVRSRGIVPLTVWGADPDLPLPRTDLDEAHRLLEEAGVTELVLTYSYDAGTTEQQQIGEVWKANLDSIGVDLVLEPLTWDARWEKAQSVPEEAQDVFTMFWFPTYVTPYDFLFSLFHTEDMPFFNLGYYSNPRFDELINEADTLSGADRETAIAMFQEAQRILVDEHAAIFMLDVPSVDVISDDFSGYEPHPAYNTVVRFYDLRITG